MKAMTFRPLEICKVSADGSMAKVSRVVIRKESHGTGWAERRNHTGKGYGQDSCPEQIRRNCQTHSNLYFVSVSWTWEGEGNHLPRWNSGNASAE